ncbi:unnamed protein product [Effrenium voratum]|nr:unnamed protein product [Effrenium voratum]
MVTTLSAAHITFGANVSNGLRRQTDWDDTLCPTSWALEQIRNCPDTAALLEAEKAHTEQLDAHAAAVVALLRAARSCARVAVVTLATKEFFTQSAETFLEGARIKELFRELGAGAFLELERAELGWGGVECWDATKPTPMPKDETPKPKPWIDLPDHITWRLVLPCCQKNCGSWIFYRHYLQETWPNCTVCGMAWSKSALAGPKWYNQNYKYQ